MLLNKSVDLFQRESVVKIKNSFSRIKSQTIKNLFGRSHKNIIRSIEIVSLHKNKNNTIK